MADYYKILTGAIEQQGLKDSTARQALYDRVRKVLDTQLAGMDSAKSAPIGEQHRKTLDEAIAKIEAASVDIVSDGALKIEPSPTVQKPEDRPLPPSGAKADSSDHFANAESAPPNTDAKPVTNPQPSAAYVAPSQRASSTTPSMPRAGSNIASRSDASLKPPTTGEHMAVETKAKRNGVRIFFMVLVVFLAGIAGLGYWQRDNLDSYAGPVINVVGEYTTLAKNKIGEITGLWETTASLSTDDDNQVDGQDNGEASPPEPDVAAQSSEIDGVSAPPNDVPVHVSSAPTEPIAVEPPSVTVVEPSEPVAPTADPAEGSPPTTIVENQAAPVAVGPAQPSAFLLVEGNADEGQPDDRYRGSANWSLAGNGTMLRIEAKVLDPESKLVIDLAKNDDSDLPATHTVTYNYTPAEAQPDGPIVNFPSLMTRVDDTSASVPLRGVGALILPNQYLMGLSDKPEDREYNTELLENAKWIVVPIVFQNNRRGLFLIEFGESGREAYAAVQSAWGEADNSQ